MSILSRIFTWLHAISLHLYPADFRAKFGTEMQVVFEQAISEHPRKSKSLRIFLRELKDLPGSLLREHWFTLTHQEIIMDQKNKKPAWFFYVAWILLSTLAIPLALALTFAVLSLITDQIGGFIFVNGQQRTTEDYLFLFVFVPLYWLLTSFLQYILLRRYLPKMVWWVVATGLGWVSVWVILQMLFSWFGSNLSIILGFILIGTLIGFSQWLLLRRRIPQAAWWILASALGWGLAALGMYTPVKNGSILAQLSLVGIAPALTTGFAWWYLLRSGARQEKSLGGL